ncbi:MAG: hypothetical protein JW987_05920 [Anaerolineaceae bacterium]|nr:hypothetical protein [Anaerolineaceae bacterium]
MKGWMAVLILGAILGVLIACVLTSGYVERQGELGQVIAERDSAQADAAAERVSSDAMGQELVNKDEQIQSANSERDQANAENEGDSAQIASLNTQVSDLSSHVSSLMLQLNDANQNFDSKSAEATRLIEQNNILQVQLDQSRQDDAAAESRIQNLETENQRLRDEYQAQVQRIAVLEASIAQSQIVVTSEEEGIFPALSSDSDSEQVYAILIIFVSIWIVLGMGVGIYLFVRRNTVRSK